MQVGLDFWRPEDDCYFRDMGATWTKLCYSGMDGPKNEEALGYIEGANAAGLNIIVDLRPTGETHQKLLGLLTKPKPDELFAAVKSMADGAARIVRECKGAVQNWEFWGEFDCPYVGGFYPQDGAVYPVYLRAIYEAIKGEDPDARVWNGGYGVNFQREFAEALIHDSPRHFDCSNWHQYNISEYWPQGPDGERAFATPQHKAVKWSADKFREMFDEIRGQMDAAGITQPFVSSEWGMPTVRQEYVDGLMKATGLRSMVFQDGVFGLGDETAVDYLDAWMQVFEDVGFEILIVHRLHDADTSGPDGDCTFWGNYCGLLHPDGTPKAMYDAVKRWVQRGNR